MGKKRHKYPQIIQEPFKQGDYIKKRSNTFFDVGYNGKHSFIPVIEVRQAVKITETKYLFNNRYCFNNLDEIIILTKEEAENLILFYKSLKLSEPESLSIEETCFTTYSGKRTEKKKYETEKAVIRILYEFVIDRPGEGFQAYKCPNCNFYHIGRQQK